MKKALRETQTLRAGRSKTDPKIFASPQTWGAGRPKFNHLEIIIIIIIYFAQTNKLTVKIQLHEQVRQGWEQLL